MRSNDGPPMLATYLQAADGTLQAPTTTPVPSHSETLAVADVNGDGIPDLVTSGTGYPAMVSVLPGLAGGGFGEPASTGVRANPCFPRARASSPSETSTATGTPTWPS